MNHSDYAVILYQGVITRFLLGQRPAEIARTLEIPLAAVIAILAKAPAERPQPARCAQGASV